MNVIMGCSVCGKTVTDGIIYAKSINTIFIKDGNTHEEGDDEPLFLCEKCLKIDEAKTAKPKGNVFSYDLEELAIGRSPINLTRVIKAIQDIIEKLKQTGDVKEIFFYLKNIEEISSQTVFELESLYTEYVKKFILY